MNRILQRGKPARFLLPYVLTVAWSVVDFLSIFLMGFVQVGLNWWISFVVKILVLLINLYFLKRFFLDFNKSHYAAFRKYAGYAAVFVYIGLNLPSTEWNSLGLIDHGQAVLLWLFASLNAAFACAIWIVLRVKKSMVFWGYLSAAESKDKKVLKKHQRERKRSVLAVVLENVDMFIQTVIIVIILQQFVFQLYVIPSESMVPTMLDGDRPLVVKALDGPEIPLSPAHVPVFAKVEPGQIVVFENPVYVKPPLMTQVMQQFLFFLTLSLVDLDRDANGNPRVHYVVKRVVAGPGEQIMMVDDVLYLRHKGEKDFVPAERDKAYAHTDLYDLPENIKSKIENLPLSKNGRDFLTKLDTLKNSADPAAIARDLSDIQAAVRQELSRIGPGEIASFERDTFPGGASDADSTYMTHQSEWESQKQSDEHIRVLPYQTRLSLYYVEALVDRIIRDPAERADFLNFISSGTSVSTESLNLYDQDSHKLNLVYKKTIAQLYLAYFRHIARGDDVFKNDNDIAALTNQANDIWTYLVVPLFSYDSRNFPAFPAGDSVIPDNKYFLMGDNRYNSLDFRFRESVEHPDGDDRAFRDLDPADPLSLRFESALGMRLLDRSAIIGRVVFRLFPFDRLGAVSP